MISIWDDHEVVDNYAGGAGPTGGLDPDKRVLARPQARGLSGLLRVDAHVRRQPQPAQGRPDLPRVALRAQHGPAHARPAPVPRRPALRRPLIATAAGCPELPRKRDFLGRTQMRWAKKRLDRSPAAWKVVANQLMVQRLFFTKDEYFVLDSWQGYPTERNELLGSHQAQEDRGRGVRHRRHPHVLRRRREGAGQRPAPGGHGVRGRRDQLARDRRRRWRPGAGLADARASPPRTGAGWPARTTCTTATASRAPRAAASGAPSGAWRASRRPPAGRCRRAATGGGWAAASRACWTERADGPTRCFERASGPSSSRRSCRSRPRARLPPGTQPGPRHRGARVARPWARRTRRWP